MPAPSARIGVLALAEPDHGGVFQYTQAVIDALSAVAPGRVVVLSPGESYQLQGAELRRLNALSGSFSARAARMASAITGLRFGSPFPETLFRDLSVILSPSPSLFPIWMGRPFITTVHDFQERYFPTFFSARERLRRRVMNRLVGRGSRFVLCESRFVQSDLTRFAGVPSDKIRVIPAPPPSGLKPADPEFLEVVRKKFSLGKDYLYYPAQFWPHKNHERAIEALAQVSREFPQLELVLSGAKKTHFEAAMTKACELGVSARVKYVGYVSYEELAALYQLSRALFMPSLFESISIPVYEAFALGTPVCAARITGVPDQAGDAAELFDPLSVPDMARAIAEILRNPARAAQLAERGRARLAGLTVERYGANLLSMLGEAETHR